MLSILAIFTSSTNIFSSTHTSQSLSLSFTDILFSRSPWTSTMSHPMNNSQFSGASNTVDESPALKTPSLYFGSRYSLVSILFQFLLLDSPSSWPLNIELPQGSVLSLLFSINILSIVELISLNVLNIFYMPMTPKYRFLILTYPLSIKLIYWLLTQHRHLVV